MRLALAILAVVGLGSSALGQSFPTLVERPNVEVSSIPRDVGDRTGDGVPDLLTQYTFLDPQSFFFPFLTRSDLRSGADGSLVRTLDIHEGGPVFGPTFIDDVDGDGQDEYLLISIPNYVGGGPSLPPPPLIAQLFNGIDDTLVWQRPLPGLEGQGGSIRVVPDRTGDGIAEILVLNRAPAFTAQFSLPTKLHWLNGATGTLVWQITDDLGDIQWAIPGPDMNGDGWTDYLVGAPTSDWVANNAGSVGVLSGLTFQYLHFWHGAEAEEQFGTGAVLVGDRDGDGTEDLLIQSRTAGKLGLFSGMTGSRLDSLTLALPGLVMTSPRRYDVDGDGVLDVGLESDPAIPGPFRRAFLSGADFGLRLTLPDNETIMGDTNGDGRPERVAIPETGVVPLPLGGLQAIRALVITALSGAQRGNAPGADADLDWAPWNGAPATGRVTLRTNAPGGSALLAVSEARASAMVPGSTLPLLVSLQPDDLLVLELLALDADGATEFPLNLDLPLLAGNVLHLQAATTSSAFEVSNRLSLLFGPVIAPNGVTP